MSYIFFFMILYVYSPGAGADSLRGQSFDINRNDFSLHSFVASFEKMSLKSDFIHFFMIKYMYITPEQGQNK